MLNQLYCDGAAKNNPGPSGCGAVLYLTMPESKVEMVQSLGTGTNNEAEYCGLLLGMREAHERYKLDKLVIRMDSALVVNQVKGQWKCKAKNLKPYLQAAQTLLKQHQPGWTLEWIPRDQNAVADRLANKAVRTDCVLPDTSPRKFLDSFIVTQPVERKD
jgi:ribonuclease HI